MMPDLHNETEYHKPVTVYLVNEGWHDYSELKKYGRVVALTEKHVDLRKTDRLRAKLAEGLSDIRSDDLLALSGSPLLNVEAAAIIMRKFGTVRYLYHEPYYSKYLKRITKPPEENTNGGEGLDYSDDER